MLGAEGISLYRSIHPAADRAPSHQGRPGEDAQYEIYKRILEGMAPGSVTIRTFDDDQDRLAGRTGGSARGSGWLGDKDRTSRQGLRGLRLSLARPDLFQAQLRALLARPSRLAAHHVSLRVGRR